MKNKTKIISQVSLAIIIAEFMAMGSGFSHQIKNIPVDQPFGLINKPVFQNAKALGVNDSMEFNIHCIAGTTGIFTDSAMTFLV